MSLVQGERKGETSEKFFFMGEFRVTESALFYCRSQLFRELHQRRRHKFTEAAHLDCERVPVLTRPLFK